MSVEMDTERTPEGLALVLHLTEMLRTRENIYRSVSSDTLSQTAKGPHGFLNFQITSRIKNEATDIKKFVSSEAHLFSL